jgi:stearoyl-CoA desaturase (delta-9 desaturase)
MKYTSKYNTWVTLAGLPLIIWLLASGSAWYLWLLSYFMVFIIVGGGMCFQTHRSWVHGAFEVRQPFRWIFTFAAHLGLHGSIIDWAGNHMVHHKNSDGAVDSHSPIQHGKKILFGYYHITPEFISSIMKFRRSLSRLTSINYLAFLHRHYYESVFAYWAIVALLVQDLSLFLHIAILPSWFGFICLSMMNYFCHVEGPGRYRNYNIDFSLNCWWMIFFTFGENWHNNHHKFPSKCSTREKWWEIDPVWLLLGWTVKK